MITITQGDSALLQLQAVDGNGNPVNITGASFTTLIKGPNGVIASFPNAQHAIVSAANGQFSLALATTDTPNCGLGANKEIITLIVASGNTTYFHGPNQLTVLPAVPLQ